MNNAIPPVTFSPLINAGLANSTPAVPKRPGIIKRERITAANAEYPITLGEIPLHDSPPHALQSLEKKDADMYFFHYRKHMVQWKSNVFKGAT